MVDTLKECLAAISGATRIVYGFKRNSVIRIFNENTSRAFTFPKEVFDALKENQADVENYLELLIAREERLLPDTGLGSEIVSVTDLGE